MTIFTVTHSYSSSCPNCNWTLEYDVVTHHADIGGIQAFNRLVQKYRMEDLRDEHENADGVELHAIVLSALDPTDDGEIETRRLLVYFPTSGKTHTAAEVDSWRHD